MESRPLSVGRAVVHTPLCLLECFVIVCYTLKGPRCSPLVCTTPFCYRPIDSFLCDLHYPLKNEFNFNNYWNLIRIAVI